MVLLIPAAPGIPGDFNDDGTVDAADYVVWRKNDGTQAGYNSLPHPLRPNNRREARSPVRMRLLPSRRPWCCSCLRLLVGVAGEVGPHSQCQNSSTRDTGQQTTVLLYDSLTGLKVRLQITRSRGCSPARAELRDQSYQSPSLHNLCRSGRDHEHYYATNFDHRVVPRVRRGWRLLLEPRPRTVKIVVCRKCGAHRREDD